MRNEIERQNFEMLGKYVGEECVCWELNVSRNTLVCVFGVFESRIFVYFVVFLGEVFVHVVFY